MKALLAAWQRTLRRRGDDRAIVEAASGRSCTFRELNDRANAWVAVHANHLRLKGRPVVFGVPNGIHWLEIFLGLMRAGAVAVPLDGAEPLPAQRAIATTLRAAAWWNGRDLEALPKPRRFRGSSTCVVKLTSGTSGRSRALAFTDVQILADARNVLATMGIRARDINYALIPFGHSYGLGNLTLPLLAHGVSVVCGSAPLPHAVAADVVRWRPTVFPTVPAVLRALAASDVPPRSLASIRATISAGAPLPLEVAQQFALRFNRSVHNFYGSSETGGIAYDRSGRATLAGSVGKPLQGVSVSSVAGTRIRVTSAAVFTLGNTRRVGNNGAWFPPDRAIIDEKGNVMLMGRRGGTVKIGGRRVNLAEVAARLRRLPGVRDVWVGVSEGAEPVLGAALATTRSVAELRAELLSDTAPWKLPKKWAVLPDLPLTARGKVDTRTLQQQVFGSR